MSTDLRTTPRHDTTMTTTSGTSTGRTLSIIGFVCAALAVFFLPIVFGPAAIVLGIVARAKGDRLGTWTIVAGVVGLVAGIALGMAVLNARNN